ncbi:MAG: Mur ligase family protein [Candidatus Moraniibacteriota bacterium]
MQIKNLAQFEAFLKTHIPTREALFVGEIGIERAKYLMRLLGNPQNKIKVIHLAGTSGKGSTAYLISHLLQSQGYAVGLSISPHIFDIRERMQIGNQLPSEKLILKYFNQILPIILQMEKSRYGAPTYFEILIGLAYYVFAKENIDYAIIETGLGGRLDGTNTVSTKNKICILTKIGLDHTEILGYTVSKIASEKAGIIQDQNTVINIQQSAKAQIIIDKKCQEKRANLFMIRPRNNYRLISSTQTETVFDFKFSKKEFDSEALLKLKNIELNLIGRHQIENCCLALACLSILSNRDNFLIDESKMRSALKNICISGRMELREIGKRYLIIDGAHNPQKMQAFITSLLVIFPQQKFNFVLAFKKGKDFEKILSHILPIANQIYLTDFSTSNQDNRASSIENIEIIAYLKQNKFEDYSIINNNEKEILSVINGSSKFVILTGSLYFIGSIYGYLQKVKPKLIS